jgi:hypothetical protein
LRTVSMEFTRLNIIQIPPRRLGDTENCLFLPS